jgi:hypothetical protein
MACDTINRGKKKTCKGSIAGVNDVFFYGDIDDAFTVVDGVATAVNPLLTTVYKYELTGTGNILTESMPSDRNTGTTTNTQTLTLVLNKITKEDNHQMNLLAKGYPRAVVKSKAGNYHIVGLTEGIDFTISPTTGGAQSDFNGYNLTGVAIENELAPIMNDATRDLFLVLVAANV